MIAQIILILNIAVLAIMMGVFSSLFFAALVGPRYPFHS